MDAVQVTVLINEALDRRLTVERHHAA